MPKTLEDFPKVAVTDLRQGPVANEDYTVFEREGRCDQHIKVQADGPQWLLLFGKRGSLCASVQSLDEDTRAAVLTFEATQEPDIVGHALAYLSPYWQAYNVWMVIDPDWGWEKKKFLGMDAVAEDFQSKDTSIIEGREVKVREVKAVTILQRTKPPRRKARFASLLPVGTTNTANCASSHRHRHGRISRSRRPLDLRELLLTICCVPRFGFCGRAMNR